MLTKNEGATSPRPAALPLQKVPWFANAGIWKAVFHNVLLTQALKENTTPAFGNTRLVALKLVNTLPLYHFANFWNMLRMMTTVPGLWQLLVDPSRKMLFQWPLEFPPAPFQYAADWKAKLFSGATRPFYSYSVPVKKDLIQSPFLVIVAATPLLFHYQVLREAEWFRNPFNSGFAQFGASQKLLSQVAISNSESALRSPSWHSRG